MSNKILIVGGVAGGASCAARMRRLDESAEIIMFEKGEYISFANCGLPYYIGDTIKDRENLIIQTPQKFKARFNVDVRIHAEVISINHAEKTVTVRTGESTYSERYDSLVLSPGTAPIRPLVRGIDSPIVFSLRTIPDTDRIRSYVDKKQTNRAVVIGGGFIGLEMAENLRHRGLDVTLVELLDQVFAPADKEMASVLHQHLTMNGVRLILGDGVKEILPTGDTEAEVLLNSGERIPTGLIVLAIGVKPDTEFAKKSGIAVNDRGAIIVDEYLRTDKPDIYAVGDAVEVVDFISGKKVHIPLAGPANRQGRIAADNIAGLKTAYKNTQGTAICKIFDLTAAVTGLNEKNALRWKIPFVKSYTHGSSHASYYPGSYPLSIKILFEPKTGKLLGAQIIGKDGIDKRIDVFATALRHGLTVYDLAELELAYAPPYGSAKDPVNIAGFVAQNILEGRMPVFYAEDVSSVDNATQVLLDVRTKTENEQGSIENSRCIPMDELRSRLNELDKHKELLIYCQVGLRGYLAARMLMQHGFSVRNLSGGYKTYSSAQTVNYDHSYLKAVPEASCSSPTSDMKNEHRRVIDACGMQCPGPIMKLKQAIDSAAIGEALEINATDQGFAADVPAWCVRTKNTLVSLNRKDGMFCAIVKKGAPSDVCTVPLSQRDKKTMVIFSNDFDRMMAAFIIANGAASMGSEVTLFFTFWGLNMLRKDRHLSVKKSITERMFGMMMPRGAAKTKLSKMNMAGLGTMMMQMEMKKKKVYPLPELIDQARKSGIKLVACTMSMDIMGIKKEELIDGVEFGGVAYYLEKADNAGYNLFI
jgi:NADPH-dependent 2,4-dienoyl-CoA reductase/sulfur reductase-like enzyme/peroxiredoxin family protein/TusA-related sulfurtransferase/rhodanese-related sulfurtransferase